MKSEYQNSIVDKIRALRLKLNYSQLDLSSLLDVSPGQIGNIETPSRPHKYTLTQLSIICDEFKVPIENLFLDDCEALSKHEVVQRLINCIIEYEK